MKDIEEYIRQIRDSVDELTKRHGQFLRTEPLVAYRGEPRDYGGTKLIPSLFRDSSYVAKEEHLFELFSDYSLVSKGASNIENAIEAQHYAAISRMLDISFDMLVALYFACGDTDADGFLYAFAFPEHYSPHSKYIEEFYDDILTGKHIAYSRNFKVFSHSLSNDRIRAQKGGFIFFPGMESYPIDPCYYQPITIHQEDKAKLRKELNLLFQINEATLFPEKDKLAEVAKKRFQNSAYAPRQVSVLDEVELFFSRIEHELKVAKAQGGALDKKEKLRWLRKEQDDITRYVLDNSSGDSAQAILRMVADNFKILRIAFKEVRDAG